MCSFAQVCHLMHDDVFKAARMLFGQLKIQRDATRLRIAGAPFRLHAADSPTLDLVADDWLPCLDQVRYRRLELFSIPGIENASALLAISVRRHMQTQLRAADLDRGTTRI